MLFKTHTLVSISIAIANMMVYALTSTASKSYDSHSDKYM